MLYDQIIHQSNLPALKLNIDLPIETLSDELKTSRSKSVAQIGNNKWIGSTIRGIASDKPRPFHEYGYASEQETPYHWQNEKGQFDHTIAFLKKNISSRDDDFYRIKIQILTPGGKIHLHNDSRTSGLGISDKSSDQDTTYILFAVHWPRNVIFNIDNRRLPIQTGDCWLLDYSRDHEVHNPTNDDRYYLLVTGLFHESDKWRELVVQSYSQNSNLVLESAIHIDHNN